MAETLIANLSKELAQLVVLRLTEIFGHGIQTPFLKATPLKLLIEIQENAMWAIPVDQVTDCKDVFELVTGQKGVPQDRYQRVYVMSLREDRIKQAIRRFFWIPTQAMLADCLTKQMISNIMYDLLHFGFWQFDNHGFDPLCAMELAQRQHIDETDIVRISQWPKQSDAPSDGFKGRERERRPEWEAPSCASFVSFSLIHFNTPACPQCQRCAQTHQCRRCLRWFCFRCCLPNNHRCVPPRSNEQNETYTIPNEL